MKHLGDITKINGAEIEPVDCISGGSPCQDLSVAGKRAGLAGARSGLFMEQIRIIKEMRQSERDHGRPVQSLRPRYCIWENVPGAFSSNGGKDFQAVLTEFVRVCEENAPDVPLPDKGKWPKAGCIYDEMGRWSIAYRLHDAQYWGVPQRRKRLCVLADFNGLTAAELLFDPQYRRGAEDATADETVGDLGGDAGPEVSSFAASLPRYTQPGGETGQGTSAGTESCVRSASTVAWTYRGRDGGCNVETQHELSYALKNPSGGGSQPNILQPHGYNQEVTATRTERGSGGADRALSVDCRNATEGEVQTSLQAKSNGGFSLNCGAVVRVNTWNASE